MAEHSATFRHSVGVLRDKVFARFMAAELVSMIGLWMQTQAQQVIVARRGGEAMEQATVSFAQMIVIPIVGIWGGALADRMDQRRILSVVIAVQIVLAVTVGVLVQHGWLQLSHLLIVAVLLGVTHAFEGPAYSALLPQLVPREKLGAAVAVDRSVFHTGRILGPALATLVASYYGSDAPAFYLNALSFVGPLIILLFFLPGLNPAALREREPERQTDLLAGWKYVWADRPTFRLICVMAANSLFCSPFVVILLTFYTSNTLGLDATMVGWLMTPSGVGALVGCFGLLAIPAGGRLFFLRTGAVLTVAAMFGLAAARGLVTAGLSVAILTLGLNLLFGIGFQIIQERAPDAIRGRVSAVVTLSFVAVMPFSGLFTAKLTGLLGMRSALIFCAIGYALVVTILFARRWPVSSQA